ncbi:ankyrin repeat domain-containing protein [Variovorax sp. CY25R-8]|uniref:ankyrin repeat domain-containing protein n=1 Tax=Variovorax sp. CY25R-8 TaxID=2855501 RepID=UPI0021BB3558|nr:ankyrin repeat domain-containing protein [Variovorax sp. CY25R-8]MCT8174451.1 ankyrin repeat domain-containing protein [Variovorax sp. CY25R-8]
MRTRSLLAIVALATSLHAAAQLSVLRPPAANLGAVPGNSISAPPSQVASPPPPVRTDYPEADGIVLWEEAVATFDGMAYDYSEFVFDTEAEAQDCAANMNAGCRRRNARSIRHLGERSNELPLKLRNAVLTTPEHAFSEPMPDLRTGKWTVIQVAGHRPSKFVGEVNPRDWVALHAALSLPSADALRSNPELKARRVLNQIRSAAELRNALASGQIDKSGINARLSNGNTLLLKAIYLKNQELLEALLAQGASLDECGIRSCPLTQAIYLGERAIAQWLLTNGANAEGNGSDITPLMAASTAADREIAEALLRAGADPLAIYTEKIETFSLERSVAFYIPSSEPAYFDWFSGIYQAALAKQGRYEWNAWIEQAGVRRPLKNGESIVLKRQPFRLLMQIPEGMAFRLAASEDEALAEKSRSPVFRRNLLGPTKVGASGPDSRYLSIGSVAMRESAWDFDGSTHYFAFTTDPKADVGVKRVRTAGRETLDSYEIDEFIADRQITPIGKFAGKSLTVLAGAVPPLGTGSDFYKPATFKLSFR